MATTRIIDLTEASALQSDDSFVIDSSRGTKKIGVGNVLDATLTEEGKFADAKAVGDALADKVDAVSGKVLSSNDYTDADKTKLAGIEAGAEVNDVTSVAGKTGAVTLVGDDVSYIDETTYAEGTVGAAISGLKSDLTQEVTDRTAADSAMAADIATKANADGVAENLTSGQTEQLLSDKYAEDSVPYQYRTSGGTADIGDREYDTVVGGTVAWNQKMENGDFASATNYIAQSGATITNVSDNIMTVNFPTGNSQVVKGISLIDGHKFFSTVDVKLYDASAELSFFGGASVTVKKTQHTTNWQTVATIWGYDVYSYWIMRNAGSVSADGTQLRNTMIIDLTQMFGSTIADYIYSLETATAGAGVAFFRSLFPNDYYPYDAGSLKSVEGVSAHVTTGFNQWDEEWEVGYINTSTGVNTNANDALRAKNLIPCINAEYYVSSPYTTASNKIRLYFYDSNESFVSVTPLEEAHSGNDYGHGLFTPPASAKYFRFAVANLQTPTYNHDICINLSWSGYRNGEYEPYVKHSYPLDSTLILRGIPKLDASNHLYYDGDTYEADGTVTRKCAVSTFPTVSTIYSDATGIGTEHYVRFTLPVVTKGLKESNDVHVIADKIVGVSFVNRGQAYTMSVNPYAGTMVEMFVPADATLEQVNNFIAGQSMTYDLLTPTTEEADPYQSPQIVDDFGTEEYVTTSIVPVGHYTKYPENLRAKIEGLPWDFSTLIAPTEKTNTATRNYTSGSLLIMGNVLYKVTANIANGGTITPGTNVTATTLSEVISALS